MANLRLKSQSVSPKANHKSQKKNAPKLVPRVDKPWDGIAYTLEVEQNHKTRADYNGYFEPAYQLGTVDPSIQTMGRIYYLTTRYWSIINPHSFTKPMKHSGLAWGDDGVGQYYDIEGPAPEKNSHRFEPANQGLMPEGHPLNVSNTFQRDAEGELTTRRTMDGQKQWGPVYPAVFKNTVDMTIKHKLQINLPEQVVQEFRAMAKAQVKDQIRKRGKPKTVLLDEAIELLARYKVPVTYQAVITMLAEVNDRPVNLRTVQMAIKRSGLIHRGTIEGFATRFYGLPGDMVDRRTITIGTERAKGSGCPMAGVDARAVLKAAKRRPKTQDKSWMPMVRLDKRQKVRAPRPT
jgi:hypothetical protein